MGRLILPANGSGLSAPRWRSVGRIRPQDTLIELDCSIHYWCSRLLPVSPDDSLLGG